MFKRENQANSIMIKGKRTILLKKIKAALRANITTKWEWGVECRIAISNVTLI